MSRFIHYKRPEDYFGPEDWPHRTEERAKREQAEWDAEFGKLPKWKQFLWHLGF